MEGREGQGTLQQPGEVPLPQLFDASLAPLASPLAIPWAPWNFLKLA